jgi:FkbM family methyltransferase
MPGTDRGGTSPPRPAAPPVSDPSWVGVGNGIRLLTSHPSDLLGVLEVYVLDVYDARRILPGSLVFDLGAGIGDFAVLASRRVGPEGRVLAVEPNPRDFSILEENVRANDCTNVVPVCGAVSGGTEPLELQFKDHTFRARPVSFRELLTLAGVEPERLPGRPVAFKIDIEGGEEEALRELGPLLPAVGSIAIELHSTQPEVDALLGPFGFVFRRLSRGAYLRRSLGFVLRHPVEGFRLWRRYRRSPGYSGLGKIVRGIDIAASPGLRVGVYRRAP